MTFQTSGGVAALVCAGTYIFGFVLLLTVLAPSGYGTSAIEGVAVVEFIRAHQGILITWNTGIYIVNAIALAVLVAALHVRLKATHPDWALVTLVFGVIWATLVLAAGMFANVAVERVVALGAKNPEMAAQVWETMYAIELGLGGGNEIAGGVWILCVSIAGWLGRSLGKVVVGLGCLTGLGGFVTIVPALGDTAGAVFGLGAIAWFIAVGIHLLWKAPDHA